MTNGYVNNFVVFTTLLIAIGRTIFASRATIAAFVGPTDAQINVFVAPGYTSLTRMHA